MPGWYCINPLSTYRKNKKKTTYKLKITHSHLLLAQHVNSQPTENLTNQTHFLDLLEHETKGSTAISQLINSSFCFSSLSSCLIHKDFPKYETQYTHKLTMWEFHWLPNLPLEKLTLMTSFDEYFEAQYLGGKIAISNYFRFNAAIWQTQKLK